MTRITVLGVGNPVMGDDAAGLELMRRLHADLTGAQVRELDDAGLVTLPSAAPPGAAAYGFGDAMSPNLVGSAEFAGVRLAFVDGGTSGLELTDDVADAESLLLLDALAASMGPAGAVRVLEGDQVPRLLASTLSPHQVGLLDVLATARLRGREPARVGVVGIVAAEADLHVGLSGPVAAAMPAAVAAARDLLERWAADA